MSATGRRGKHEQCTGSIALSDGQIASEDDADNVAVGSGTCARARGTATGGDHSGSVAVTVQVLP